MDSYTTYKSRISRDSSDSRIAENFLDMVFYPSINVTPSRNRTDKSRQVKGVDVEFDFNGYHYVCDEKANTRYIGRNLRTFCLECSQRARWGNHEQIEGWFTKKDNINNSYLFLWIDSSRNSDNSLGNEKDVTRAEMCLVRKDEILDYLEKRGLTEEKIESICKLMLDTGLDSYYEDDIKFRCSYNLEERPVNIILPREVYRDLADVHMNFPKSRKK